ncbi:uncharacterized protein LOC135091256 [Scylla paramamosain]|uniref:uncharacterized protein LOC135091256 n=1 Tax=Scylla paramamosain TaxID=85552 RepID=UPI0030831416
MTHPRQAWVCLLIMTLALPCLSQQNSLVVWCLVWATLCGIASQSFRTRASRPQDTWMVHWAPHIHPSLPEPVHPDPKTHGWSTWCHTSTSAFHNLCPGPKTPAWSTQLI